MNREALIHRIVDRKLQNPAATRAFCVCIASPSKAPAAKK